MTRENDAVEDLTTRVAVITGANSGIGLAAAEELARRGWSVTLVARDAQRLAAAADRVRALASAPVFAHQCDFAVLADVRELAATLRAEHPRIDLLANNAGGAFPQRRTTVDGFEHTIQVNHLAHFLLSHQVRDLLRGGRIVNTASSAHSQGALDPTDLSSQRHAYRMFRVYGGAKQANILFAAEAARRWPEIVSTSYHPGVVRTRFGNESPAIAFFYRVAGRLIRTPRKGAETMVWLGCVDAGEVTPGGYYMDNRLRRPSAKATDAGTAAQLWQTSLDAVGLTATV